jgi:hypothetical protein
MSQYFVCPKCGYQGSKADRYYWRINGMRVAYSDTTWCGGCNPNPPRSEWGYADVHVLPGATPEEWETARVIALDLHRQGVKNVAVNGTRIEVPT